MTRCDECAFDYTDHAPPRVMGELAAAGQRLAARLRVAVDDPGMTTRLGVRPSADAWSALEYACHVRDVLLVQRERFLRALVEDTPVIDPMHRAHRPRLSGYAFTDPVRLAVHLEVATELLVDVGDRLDRGDWRRTCIYNHPVPSEVDLAWVATHTLHECVHHPGEFDRALAEAFDAS